MTPPQWPGDPPSSGSFFLFGADQVAWMEKALVYLRAQLDAVRLDGALQHADLDRVATQVDHLYSLVRTPTHGAVTVHVGATPRMTIPAHPTDRIQYSVAWQNAENQVVPEVHATVWTVTDSAGAPASIGALVPDPSNDEQGSVEPPLAFGEYVFVSTTQDEAGADVVAKSDVVQVADTNPTHGTLLIVAGAPAAAAPTA